MTVFFGVTLGEVETGYGGKFNEPGQRREKEKAVKEHLTKEGAYRNLFLVAALYDFILGAVFFVFWQPIFDNILNIPRPNNLVYLAFYQGAAAFVFNMGIGFYFVYRNMYRNVDIVKLGIIFKIFYSAVAFYWVIVEGMPGIFALFGLVDLVFIAFFILFLRAYNREIKYGAG